MVRVRPNSRDTTVTSREPRPAAEDPGAAPPRGTFETNGVAAAVVAGLVGAAGDGARSPPIEQEL